jgi:hypothetical protein
VALEIDREREAGDHELDQRSRCEVPPDVVQMEVAEDDVVRRADCRQSARRGEAE